MSHQPLIDEITNDPAPMGYRDGGGNLKADSVIAGLMNDLTQSRNRARMTGAEIKDALASVDISAMVDEKFNQYLSWVA